MIENSFRDCILNLRVADRVEALVLNVLKGQSKLETLRNSYQTGLRSHGKNILSVLSTKNEEDKTEILHAHLQNLEEQVESLQNLEDVDKIEVAWIALNESYEDFKEDDAKVSEQTKQLQTVRKKCNTFIREAQLKLEEYCQRIMIQAEEHRACKSSFDDNLSAELRMIKQNFTELLKDMFQQRRVEKLKVLVDEFDLVNMDKCNKRVEAYQNSIKKRKFLMRRVYQAEKELRSCQFKLRKVPYVHYESITGASRTISSSTAKLITMGNLYSQLSDTMRTDLEISQRQKIVLDKKLAELLQSTTKIQIELCDVIKQAIRQQIYRHDDLCCLTPEDFDACVR
ncbi:hypothetical protein GCK72_025633 [Caenorhabditis remanei]|uniref:Uncharacterized protein n=1 Tax=Caenorhabditis remanei TaxID=31234 RepID=A0A6A5G2N6_CAERE|nr:hypothetical protein GCK72_025633 [Caenorhabditis remanei]KAF1749166.1 hypothetical protein GCK72_025633 [Caenorhabditis remanei]